MNLATTLLIAFLVSLVATIFSSLLPGLWWQYALTTIVLLAAAAVASSEEGDR